MASTGERDGKLTLAGFAAAGLAALALSGTVYWFFDRQMQAEAWIAHTHEVRAAGARLRADIWEDARAAIATDLAALRELTRDNPRQQARLDDIGLKLADHASMTDASLRRDLAAVDAEEQALLQQRLQGHERAFVEFLAVVAVVILALFAALAALYRVVRKRQSQAEALQESEQRFETFVRNVVDHAIFTLDPGGRVRSWNPGAERSKGYTADEIIGQPLSIFYTPEDIAAGKPELALERAAAEGHYEAEGWRVRKDGSWFWANVTITALRREDGTLQGFGKVTHDLTHRKRHEDHLEAMVNERTSDLRQAKDRLEELSKRLIHAQEEERKRISRELHDETGQALTGIRLRLKSALGGDDDRRQLEECVKIVDHAVVHIRGLAVNLRPLMLDDLGLADALQWMLDQQAKTAGWKSSIVAEDTPPLDPDLQTACYRIAQEALTNAARHAAASEVWIELRVRAGKVELVVVDNGRGFDKDAFGSAEERRKHFGLVSMSERAALVGGEVRIESSTDGGTRVHAAFPLATA